MFLRRVRVHDFRGIGRLDLALEPTTVLIGENNSGKTSLLEALRICLGPCPGGPFPFRDSDFRRVADEISSGESTEGPPPIRVRLRFRERTPDEWDLKGEALDAVTRRRAGRLEIRLEIVARLEKTKRVDPAAGERADSGLEASTRGAVHPAAGAGRADVTPGGSIRTSWRFLDSSNAPIENATDPELLLSIRRRCPFLLLRADRSLAGSPAAESASTHAPAADPCTEADAPIPADDVAELDREIRRVLDDLASSRDPKASPALAHSLALVRDYVEAAAHRHPEADPGRILEALVETPRPFLRRDSSAGPLEGSGVRSVASLLVTGALLRARGLDVLGANASPIVAVEEPEAHLHPHVLASVWSLVDAFPTQKIVTTNSGELLAALPLSAIRRLVSREDRIRVFQPGRKLTIDERRRIGYHIRVQRGDAFFARCWLLVEGETEFWLLPEFARILGWDFFAEGVRCVEFAQCGVEPLVKLARNAGIEWHLVTDGDMAGRGYEDDALAHLGRKQPADRITRLEERDMEHYLWNRGFADVYRRVARMPTKGPAADRALTEPATAVIDRAVRAESKPHLALEVVEAAAARGREAVPDEIRTLVESVVRLARMG